MHEDLSTRERIKRAARRLFALNGVDAVAVRDIISAAGQKNVSALNYYFGSKEGLLERLIGDALAIAHARWDNGLDALEATGGPAASGTSSNCSCFRDCRRTRRRATKPRLALSPWCCKPGAISCSPRLRAAG